jgi:acetoacetyl-CoA reductase
MARVALVTGGTRGIGLAISLALKAQGRKVIANYPPADIFRLSPEVPNDAVAEAFSREYDIETSEFDVSSFESCKAGIAKIVAEHGPIEVLVNNAGITRDVTLAKMTRDMWDVVIATDLGSCFNTCKLTFDGMRERKFGRVVNVGSLVGQAGQYGQANYAAAKSGIHGFTMALALEGARHGIIANDIAPGLIETEMTHAIPAEVLKMIIGRVPVGHMGEAADIARGVAFLTSDDAKYITGSTISINGGMHMY